jgi:hypothetical protein
MSGPMTIIPSSFLATRRLVGGVLTILMIALVVYLAWPVTSAETPFWEVWVVDGAGRPVEGITVNLIYRNWSAESEDLWEEKQTNSSGYVAFSPRSLRATRVHRILAAIRSAEAGVHASFGPHAFVNAHYKNGGGGDDFVTWRGTPSHMTSKIVAKPPPPSIGFR